MPTDPDRLDQDIEAPRQEPNAAAEQPKGIVEITSRPAAGDEPARVSLYIDGRRRFTVHTSDLENIGSQLRGKTSFSFFNTVLPIVITLLTVAGTTIIGQLFQYVSWRNSNALQTTTLQVQHALSTFQKASAAIDKRYYETNTFLAATRNLANEKNGTGDTIHGMAISLNQQRFNAFYAQLKSWHEDYDETLAAIDYTLDHPVNLHEHVSIHDFVENDKPKFDCRKLMVGQLKPPRINSLKLQFAALNYCFSQSIKGFDDGEHDAVIDSTSAISDEIRKQASDLNDDVYSMSNEFRCFAQHRIEFLEQRKQTAIFRLPTWLYDNTIGHVKAWFTKPDDLTALHFNQTLTACTFG